MPRPRRPDFTHTYHHVVIRGINGLRLFNTEAKREYFLSIMRSVRMEHDLSVYAMGFLDNHLHLFVRRNSHSLGRFFQRLKGRYTQWYNDKFDRKGTLYDGRYYSSLVDSETYFQTMWEYVQRQGVAAGLFDSPLDDPWSTARLYAGIDERFDWIDWEEAFEELDVPADDRRPTWQDESASEWLKDGPPVNRHRDQNFIAEDAFVEKYMQIRKQATRSHRRNESPMTWETIMNRAELFSGFDRDALLRNTKERTVNKFRCLLAWAGRAFCHKSVEEIAQRMNVTAATVSKMIKRAREKYQTELQDWEKLLKNENINV